MNSNQISIFLGFVMAGIVAFSCFNVYKLGQLKADRDCLSHLEKIHDALKEEKL